MFSAACHPASELLHALAPKDPTLIELDQFQRMLVPMASIYLTTAHSGLEPVEIDAAWAQSLSDRQIFGCIILPSVLSLFVPALTNPCSNNI
jgi:ABC-type amino acid transport system permease subunit